MEILSLIISIIALAIAFLAYHKAGGITSLKKQTEVLTNVGDTIVKASDSLRDRTANLLDKMEGAVRSTEVDKGKQEAKKEQETV